MQEGFFFFHHFYRFRFGTYEYFVLKDFHPLASVSASVFLFLPVLVNVFIVYQITYPTHCSTTVSNPMVM